MSEFSINIDLDDVVEEYETEQKTWRINTDEEAEWLVDKTNEEIEEIERLEQSTIDMINKYKEKLEKVKAEKERKIAMRDSYLMDYFERVEDKYKKKTKTQEKYRLPSGDIVKKFQNPELKRDESMLVEWAKSTNLVDYIEVAEKVKWSDLKKATKVMGDIVIFEDTGEIVEGIQVVERPPKFEFKPS